VIRKRGAGKHFGDQTIRKRGDEKVLATMWLEK
jgi:hypothetical protein